MSRKIRLLAGGTLLAGLLGGGLVALPAPAEAAVTLPAGNLVANPSFETDLSGWTVPGGTHARVNVGAAAPHGSYVDRITWTGGSYFGIDAYGGQVSSTSAGVRYRGAVSLRAFASSSVGKPAQLIVRERTQSGTYVGESDSTVLPLTSAFQQLTVDVTAQGNGDILDIYVVQTSAGTGNSFDADAFSLVATGLVPSRTATGNPSFESDLNGWGGGNNRTVTRVQSNNAPDGQYVARVAVQTAGSNYSLDDYPGNVTSTKKGGVYVASARVAASTGTLGKSAVLVVREHTPAGAYVTEWDSPALPLSAAFQELKVTATPTVNGDYLDEYVFMTTSASGDAFLMDATSLTEAGSSLQEQALNQGSQNVLGDVSQFRHVLLQDNMYDKVAGIRSASPGTKVLGYQNFATVISDTDCGSQYFAHPSTGITYCTAKANPEWFLYDSNGNKLTYPDYPYLYAMDVSNTAYVTAWKNAVLSRIPADGFDGVMLDDVNPSIGHGITAPVYRQRNGSLSQLTDTAYGNAVISAMQTINPALTGAGLLAIPNLGVNLGYADQIQFAKTIGLVSSQINLEHWMSYDATGDAFFTGSLWTTYLQFLEDLNAQGTPVIVDTQGSQAETGLMQYSRASFLLGWNGAAGSASEFVSENVAIGTQTNPNWLSNPGLPTEPRRFVSGVWRRSFTNGLVLVNPGTAAATVQLDRTYTDPTGASVSGTLSIPAGSGTTLVG